MDATNDLAEVSHPASRGGRSQIQADQIRSPDHLTFSYQDEVLGTVCGMHQRWPSTLRPFPWRREKG